jgi:hypothetical protein
MVSLECVYGLSVSGDFKNLVTALLRDGVSFECAVGEFYTANMAIHIHGRRFICRRRPNIAQIAGLYLKTSVLTRPCRTMNPMSTANLLKVCLLVTLKYNAM